MRVLVGLGNPGAEYAETRHNAGWLLLDNLVAKGKVVERRTREWVELEKLRLGADNLWLVRSRTYMNSSGLGVAQACSSLQIEPRDVVVTYDDIDLPLGALRLRRSGGTGGHRGLESLIAELGTQKIARLRLGVRGTHDLGNAADYVLAKFNDDEMELRDRMIDRATAAVRMILRRGFGTAMNSFNQKDPAIEP